MHSARDRLRRPHRYRHQRRAGRAALPRQRRVLRLHVPPARGPAYDDDWAHGAHLHIRLRALRAVRGELVALHAAVLLDGPMDELLPAAAGVRRGVQPHQVLHALHRRRLQQPHRNHLLHRVAQGARGAVPHRGPGQDAAIHRRLARGVHLLAQPAAHSHPLDALPPPHDPRVHLGLWADDSHRLRHAHRAAVAHRAERRAGQAQGAGRVLPRARLAHPLLGCADVGARGRRRPRRAPHHALLPGPEHLVPSGELQGERPEEGLRVPLGPRRAGFPRRGLLGARPAVDGGGDRPEPQPHPRPGEHRAEPGGGHRSPGDHHLRAGDARDRLHGARHDRGVRAAAACAQGRAQRRDLWPVPVPRPQDDDGERVPVPPPAHRHGPAAVPARELPQEGHPHHRQPLHPPAARVPCRAVDPALQQADGAILPGHDCGADGRALVPRAAPLLRNGTRGAGRVYDRRNRGGRRDNGGCRGVLAAPLRRKQEGWGAAAVGDVLSLN
mmetsp:Transcript_27091/g.92503  ORF Transcript_27091/g.92503 Transcript_27091/m.92503 type:complete len:498 (-) Transcript_27091:1573-3066(-)